MYCVASSLMTTKKYDFILVALVQSVAPPITCKMRRQRIADRFWWENALTHPSFSEGGFVISALCDSILYSIMAHYVMKLHFVLTPYLTAFVFQFL